MIALDYFHSVNIQKKWLEGSQDRNILELEFSARLLNEYTVFPKNSQAK